MRANPSQSAGMGYTGGGSRCLIDEVDDKSTMQSMKGTMMKGEGGKDIEAPQNYGFTSMVMPADKGKNGQIEGSAEGFMSYMGGNRSFPVCGVMDDRRHRVKGMEKGDSAMYRTREDGQQFHLSDKGNFMTCRNDRVQRIALIDPPKDEEQQQAAKQPTQGQGGASDTQESGAKKPKGQKLVRDDNQKSKVFFEQSKDVTHTAHNDGHTEVKGDKVTSYVGSAADSMTVKKGHVHIMGGGAEYWVAGGNYASSPVVINPDPEGAGQSGSPGAPAGAPMA